jgi:hypothetical protein
MADSKKLAYIPIGYQLENRFLLGAFGPIFRAPAITPLDAVRVQGSTHDVVAYPRQVLYTPATNQHHRVLLQVVPLARNVGRHLNTIGQTNTGNLAKGRVRLLGSSGFDLSADTSFLRVSSTPGGTASKSIVTEAESRCLSLLGYAFTPFPH